MLNFVFSFSFFVFFFNSAVALNVSPIELFLDSSDPNLTTSLKLQNKTEKSIPVELKMFRRFHHLEKESRIDTKDFLIYPPQLILKPGNTQTVRLVWMGQNQENKKVESEIAYRLLIKQVPLETKSEIKVKKPESSLNIIYEYVASVYVQPKQLKSKLEVNLKGYDNQSRNLGAVIKNIGNTHLLLSQYEYFAKVDGAKTLVRLEPEKKLLTTNLLADEQREFRFTGVKELENKKFILTSKLKTKDKVSE